MYGGRKVGFVRVLFVALLDDYVRGNQFGEIVHDEPCEDFLEDVLHLFSMEVQKAQSVLKRAKRGFNAPTHGIEIFQFRRRKRF